MPRWLDRALLVIVVVWIANTTLWTIGNLARSNWGRAAFWFSNAAVLSAIEFVTYRRRKLRHPHPDSN